MAGWLAGRNAMPGFSNKCNIGWSTVRRHASCFARFEEKLARSDGVGVKYRWKRQGMYYGFVYEEGEGGYDREWGYRQRELQGMKMLLEETEKY